MISKGKGIINTNPVEETILREYHPTKPVPYFVRRLDLSWMLTPFLKKGEIRRSDEQRRNRIPRRGTKERETLEKEAKLSGGAFTAQDLWELKLKEQMELDYYKSSPDQIPDPSDLIDQGPAQDSFPDDDDLPDFENMPESPLWGASSDKATQLSSETLEWFCEAFLGLDRVTGRFNRVRESDWRVWFPDFDAKTQAFAKSKFALNPKYIEGSDQNPEMASMVRMPYTIVDRAKNMVFTRLGARHVLTHLNHELLLEEDYRLFIRRYHWIVTGVHSQEKYPPCICFDLDKVDQLGRRTKWKERASAKGQQLSEDRSSTVVLDFIRKLSDLMAPATPLIFCSSSGKKDKYHVYFLLSPESMAIERTCAELQETFERLLTPLFEEFRIKGFADGTVEFYPNPKKMLIAPLGMNSRLFTLRKGGAIREYLKQGTHGYEKSSTINSVKYLEKQFNTGAYKKLDLKAIEEMAPPYPKEVNDITAWCKSSAIPNPVDESEDEDNEAPDDNLKKKSPYRMGDYPGDFMNVAMPTGLNTTKFLHGVILNKIARLHLDQDWDPDEDKLIADGARWIKKHLNNKNSRRGATGWLEENNRDLREVVYEFVDNWNPEKIHREKTDATKYLVTYLFKVIECTKFKCSPKRHGMINWRAFMFALEMLKVFSPFWKYGKSYPCTVEFKTGIGYLTTRKVANQIVRLRGIYGISKNTIQEYREGFEQFDVFRVNVPDRSEESLTSEWTFVSPVDLREMYFDYRTDVRVLALRIIGKDLLNRMLNKRNLARIQKEMIEEGVIEKKIL